MHRLWDLFKNNRLLTVIILIAVFVRFIGLVPNIAHTDEAYIIKHSKELFYGIVERGDFDPHAYKYGSFIFYLQSLVYLPIALVGFILTTLGIAQPPPSGFGNRAIDFIEYAAAPTSSDSFVFLFGRALTAVLGVLSVLVVYLLGKKLFARNVGLFAAFILAVNPFHVRDSHYITTDVLFVLLVLLSLLLLVNAVANARVKWYMWAGFITGLSATIKFFPLALLFYPFIFLLVDKKNEQGYKKFALSLLIIPFGFFVGVPFLFFNPESRSLLALEAGAQFLWYGTSITAFISSLISYFMSRGTSEILSLSTLIPTEFTPFHSSFLFFRVFGPALLITSLLGVVTAFVRYRAKAALLFVVPFAVFVYNSFYIPAVYERLNLPIVPFLCIFTAVFFVSLYDVLQKSITAFKKTPPLGGNELNADISPSFRGGNPVRKNGEDVIKDVSAARTIFLSVALLVFIYPVRESFASSLSCSISSDMQGNEWVEQNIPGGAKIAQVSPLSLPNKNFQIKEVRPDTEFFLSELQENGIEYFFMNTGIMSRFIYQFENNFFLIPDELYQNYFVPLALFEYRTRASLLSHFSRSRMCDPEEYFYYKVPEVETANKELAKSFAFTDRVELNSWTLENLGEGSRVEVLFNNSEGNGKSGSLEYKWNHIYYRGPRVSLSKIPIVAGGVYTFSGWVKSSEFLEENARDGFLRMDFYSVEEDVNLPGEVVALSPRTFGESKWRNVEVSAKAPEGASFVVFSINVIGTKNIGSFYFDDLEFFGPGNE